MDARPRLKSLDQFRGWAVFTMVLVNVLGWFKIMPETFRHHDYGFSFADSVQPFFLFVVGIGLGLSFKSYGAAFKRCAFLAVLGVIFWSALKLLLNQKGWASLWPLRGDALTDIGLAGLVSLLVIKRSILTRFIFALSCAVLLQVITDLKYPFSEALGFLGWSFPLLMGMILADCLRASKERIPTVCLSWGLPLTIVGLILSSHWPFSQKFMTCSYSITSTGLGFLAFLAFHAVNDLWGKSLPHLSTLGKNALLVYLLHTILFRIVRVSDITNRYANALVALTVFAVIYLVCYLSSLYLEKKNKFLKI